MSTTKEWLPLQSYEKGRRCRGHNSLRRLMAKLKLWEQELVDRTKASSVMQQLSPLRYPLCDSWVLNVLEKSAQHSYDSYSFPVGMWFYRNLVNITEFSYN